MKLKGAKTKIVNVKIIVSVLLIGVTVIYIVSAYLSTISMAKEKYSIDVPKPEISKQNSEKRLEKLISYSIGNKNQTSEIVAPPEITAKAGIISEMSSDRILYEKNISSKVPMASTTKIMTFIIAIENCEDLYETVTVSRQAAYTEGSTMHLAEGETITVHDLLYGLLLNSGNDAAVAIAEHVGGSIDEFCNMMNDRAVSIGATNTNFKTPHGLDVDGHYTTAYDLALIAKEAYKQPLFRKIISTSSIYLSGHNLKNTNPLLGRYDEVTGGKTGYTGGAGRCIVFFIEYNSLQAVAVLLNCPTSAERVNDSNKLIKYTSQNFNTYTLLERGTRIDYFPIEKGREKEIYGIVDDNICITLATWEETHFTVSYKRNFEKLTAPVKYSDILGKICINWGTHENKTFDININVTAEHSVLRKTYTDHLGDMIKSLPYVLN